MANGKRPAGVGPQSKVQGWRVRLVESGRLTATWSVEGEEEQAHPGMTTPPDDAFPIRSATQRFPTNRQIK
jgi:hypothetical protein